jgi:hypothetical protein
MDAMSMPRLNRRQFVAGTAAAAASTACVTRALASAPALVLCDHRCAQWLQPADHASELAWFQGDVTQLWYTRLRPLWASGHATVTGISLAPALSCLEHLARRTRHHVVSRHTIPGTSALRWVISPTRSQGWT